MKQIYINYFYVLGTVNKVYLILAHMEHLVQQFLSPFFGFWHEIYYDIELTTLNYLFCKLPPLLDCEHHEGKS